MPQLLDSISAQPATVLAVAIVLAVFAVVFAVWLVSAARLYRKLGRLTSAVGSLRRIGESDPKGMVIKDQRLNHLWQEYCGTLHVPSGALDPRTGILDQGSYRATIPAEVIFNPQAVFEGRLGTEFFKHVPGICTGLGIIGTFAGLINGLGRAVYAGGLDTPLLISSVKEAFYVSAAAIVVAMVVTFLEKLLVAGLHGKVEKLCQEIDNLFSSGVGEEYLKRLVDASEESASQARILKDALGELTAVLERLTQHQIAAVTRQQEQLQQHIAASIETGLKQPLAEIAQGFSHFQNRQGDQLTQGLQDSMAAFADKLDRMLGGQINQARELQAQTLQSLEAAATAFQAMSKDVGQAGAMATSNMAASIGGVLDQMAARQGEMNSAMCQLADGVRGVVVQTQAETQSHLGRVVDELGKQVAGVVEQLQSEARASSAAHGDRLAEVTTHARESIDALAEGVRAQTAAMEQVTGTVRAAVAELSSSVSRNVALMGEDADEMRQAAEQFTVSGRAISEVMERSRETSAQFVQSAATLSSASHEIEQVIGDYRAARETFAGIVEGLHGVVDTAKREVAMTSDLVSRLEAASQKLIKAQGEADEYLAKVSEVLAHAHRSFSDQMIETVGRANSGFHEHLTKATSLLASSVADLGDTLVDLAPRHRGAS